MNTTIPTVSPISVLLSPEGKTPKNPTGRATSQERETHLYLPALLIFPCSVRRDAGGEEKSGVEVVREEIVNGTLTGSTMWPSRFAGTMIVPAIVSQAFPRVPATTPQGEPIIGYAVPGSTESLTSGSAIATALKLWSVKGPDSRTVIDRANASLSKEEEKLLVKIAAQAARERKAREMIERAGAILNPLDSATIVSLSAGLTPLFDAQGIEASHLREYARTREDLTYNTTDGFQSVEQAEQVEQAAK